jgi:hypothetical protein
MKNKNTDPDQQELLRILADLNPKPSKEFRFLDGEVLE